MSHIRARIYLTEVLGYANTCNARRAVNSGHIGLLEALAERPIAYEEVE